MTHIASTFGIAALVVLLTSPTFADPKPKGAKPPDAQTLANFYAGKTTIWKSCDGGIYFGGEWQAQATCRKKGKSVGLGKWSVSRDGRVCWQLNWYWPNGADGVGTKIEPQSCTYHLVDANGTMWRRWQDDAEWWKPNDASGFKFKRHITRLRKELNV